MNNQVLSSEIAQYYTLANESYARYGSLQDGNTPATPHALHSGYFEEGLEGVTHQELVVNMTNKIVESLRLPDSSEHTVLENGCGVGNISFNIALKYSHIDVYATNITPLQVEIARQFCDRAQLENIMILLANYNKLPILDGSIDRVVFCESLCHSPDQYLSMQESLRVLKVGGSVFVADVFLNPNFQEDVHTNLLLADFQNGWFIPELRTPPDFCRMCLEVGFKEAHLLRDVTENVMPSAILIGNRASKNLANDLEGIPEIIIQSKKAASALGKLIEKGTLVYQWYELTK